MKEIKKSISRMYYVSNNFFWFYCIIDWKSVRAAQLECCCVSSMIAITWTLLCECCSISVCCFWCCLNVEALWNLFRSASYRNMKESYCLYAKLENLQSMENCKQGEYISDNVGSNCKILNYWVEIVCFCWSIVLQSCIGKCLADKLWMRR